MIMALGVLALPVLLVLSEPARPLWLPRYLLWSGAVFLILAGVGASWLAGRWPVAGTVGAAALLLINVLPYYGAETAPRWDLAAAALAPAIAAGANVYVDDNGVPTMLRAYLPGGAAALPKHKPLLLIEDAETRLRAGSPVIAVHGPTGQELTSPMSVFRARLQQLGTPAGETSIGQEIVLIRFNPSPESDSGPAVSDARPSP
jgi:mannosyltransferase